MRLNNEAYQKSIVKELTNLPKETEWVEFKYNNSDPTQIGEYISALANSAALNYKPKAYILWGVNDDTHEILGTTFKPHKKKIGNEELESWILQRLRPKINFKFYNLNIDDRDIVLLEINAAARHPVQFTNVEYIRVGTYKKKLKDFPERERDLWRIFDQTKFEEKIAVENLSSNEVLNLLDYPSYFDLLELPLPSRKQGILSTLKEDGMISPSSVSGIWNISNLGAILFAKKLFNFRGLRRKAVRVILYKDNTKMETIREQEGVKGYASGFENLIDFILTIIPTNEVIGKALRKDVPMFPELAIRELVANAIIHQDFMQSGTGPMIEIFPNRMEITNPGLPLVKTERFLDNPPKSRNELLASFMRRIGVCEERGSGIDKVVIQTEVYQLPAPVFETTDEHTRAILFTHKDLKDMDKAERIHATYMHSCLKYVQRDYMTNSTLRNRFGIDSKNSAMASRIIRDSLDDKAIVCYDETVGARAKKYIPWWANE